MSIFNNLATKYAKYYLMSKSEHGIHSPFVFEFITKVLNDKTVYEDYAKVENLRHDLLSNKELIEVEDLGAGAVAKTSHLKKIKICEIANKAALPAKYGKLLYRIAQFYKVKNLLELGTSLGITSSYQTFGALQNNKEAKLFTIEGSKNVAEKAQQNFEHLKIQKNIDSIIGNFDHVLENTIQKMESIDMVFVDGNHRLEPTVAYFNTILKQSHNDTIFVFDDINWSNEMMEAWNQIKAHPQTKVTIDLFFIGIVFIRAEMQKEDYVLKY